MTQQFFFNRCLLLLPLLLLVGGCSSDKIVFLYPDEAMDFGADNLKPPSVYIDAVTDMRPPLQRDGQGHFFGITFPDDKSWERTPTLIYADALAQDVEQTNLFEMVPLQSQADYVLSADILSMSCRLQRSPLSFLLAGAVGGVLGVALGDDSAQRVKLGTAMAVAGILAIPLPTSMRAEAEIRLTLADHEGNIIWQDACLGEMDGKKSMSATARQDQQLVDEFLTVAVKRSNACLLGQVRNVVFERGQ